MRLTPIFVLLYCLPLFIFAQDYAVDLIPNNLKSRASAIVRDENITVNMTNDANITESISRTITILNNSGEDYAHLTLYYNKGKVIRKISGTVYDEFGQAIKKFGTKDFSDRSAIGQASLYDDVRFKYYNPNMRTYPYTITYTYEVKHNQNLYIPYWRPNVFSDVAVQNSRYQIVYKPNHELRIKEHNVPNKAIIETTDKIKTYTWNAKDLAARKREPFSPIRRPDEITVKTALKSFRFFKKKGEIENWNDLGKWVYDALLEDKSDLSDATKAKVQEIVALYDTDKEKAKALYAYMQQKTRYISIQVGIGGIEPFPASYVDRLGYGDCKALVNYMQALLAAANIESHYCIVEANRTKIDLDQDFANIVDGNHIILCIPFENDTTWLECTNNKIPFGYLGDFTDDRLVLACTANGGKILRTPKYDTHANLQQRNGQFLIGTDGSLTGSIQTVFSGAQFDNHFEFVSLSGSELDRGLKKAYDINNIQFNAVTYSTDYKENTNRITENIDLDIRNYVAKNGGNLIIQPNIFNQSVAIPESKNRINEVYINRGYTDIDEIEFTLSEPVKEQSAPIHRELSCPMANYELKVTVDGNKINFYRKIEIHDGTYAPADYESYFIFMREVAATDRGKYQLPLASNYFFSYLSATFRGISSFG